LISEKFWFINKIVLFDFVLSDSLPYIKNIIIGKSKSNDIKFI
jgi:hypothetical protein